MSFTAFGLVGAGVMKAFHIANDLSELKEILRDIRRSLEDHSPRGSLQATARNQDTLLRELDETGYVAAIQARVAQESASPLVRAVNAESELPPLTPEVLAPPQRQS